MINFSFYDLFRKQLDQHNAHESINKDTAAVLLSQFISDRCISIDISTTDLYSSYGVRTEVCLVLYSNELDTVAASTYVQDKDCVPEINKKDQKQQTKKQVSRFHNFLDGETDGF